MSLSLNGRLSGTPTQSGDFPLAVCAVDLAASVACMSPRPVLTVNAAQPAPAPTGLTGTWRGTWTEPVFGFSGFGGNQTWDLTWVLVQSGTIVGGPFTRTMTKCNAADPVFCDRVGTIRRGDLDGSVSGTTLTIKEVGILGEAFRGTFTNTTIKGTHCILPNCAPEEGSPFSLTRQ